MATVTRENIGLLNDRLVVKVEKNDYLPSFEKAMKEYSKKANIPGFRKGMVPPSLIKKMYGHSVFTEEVLKSVEKELTSFMSQEKLDIFAQPLPMPENDAHHLDMTKPEEYSFSFEVGLKPAFQLADLNSMTPTRYKVTVTEEMIDEELERLRVRHGKMTDPESVSSEEDALNVTFIESNELGEPVTGGITKDNSLLVKYFTPDARARWMGKKNRDFEIVQLSTAFDDKEREWVLHDLGLSKDDATAGDRHFKVLLNKIGLVEKATLDPEFFETVFPGKNITTEEDLRRKISEDTQRYWDTQSSNQLQHSLYHDLLHQTKIEFPESFLKRWMQRSGEKGKPRKK